MKKDRQSNRKMGTQSEQANTTEIEKTNKLMKRQLISLVMREMKIKTIMGSHFPCPISKSLKILITSNAGREGA